MSTKSGNRKLAKCAKKTPVTGAPQVPPQVPRVRYVGAVGDPTGYGTAAREHCLALNEVKYPFVLSEENVTSFATRDPSLPVTRDTKGYDINILHVLPDQMAALKTKYPAKYNIGYLAWETDSLTQEFINGLGVCNEFWVPCEDNKLVLERYFPDRPVSIIPHPVVYKIPSHEVLSLVGIKEETIVFGSVSHYQKRKNFLDLIRAFACAFTSKDPVALVLKVGGEKACHQFFDDISRLERELGFSDPPVMKILTNFMDTKALNALMNRIDIYCSFSHAEGFGFGPARAMYLERPVVITDIPGHGVYADEENSYLVRTFRSPVEDEYPPFQGRMSWHSPDLESAENQLLAAYHEFDTEQQEEKVSRAKRNILNSFSYKKIGLLMKTRLDELLGGESPLVEEAEPVMRVEEV